MTTPVILHYQNLMEMVDDELVKAITKHPHKFNSTHEGYAIILEELDEAWDEIKRNNLKDARKEMLQVAAVALRFLLDLPEPEEEVAE